VYIDSVAIDANFNGKIPVENRYAFTNLKQCKFKWQLVKFPSAKSATTKPIVIAAGNPQSPDIAPGAKGIINLNLPLTWQKNDALYFTAYGPKGEELFTWSWAIKPPALLNKIPGGLAKGSITTNEGGNELIVSCDGIKYYFDKTTGYIEKVAKPKGDISLSGGPVLAGVKTSLKEFTFKAAGTQYVVEAAYEGDATLHIKWIFNPGHPVKLEYNYSQTGDVDFTGISFNYPEAKITGMKWLGRGPYRVWQNRLKGQKFGVWHKACNNTITGETWGYPEFKGYHAEVNWLVLENKESPFTVYTTDKNLYVQMLHPAREKDALKNNNVEPPFPAGDISFLNAISAIGTKFQPAKVMGPQSQKFHSDGKVVSGVLWFDFR
jgi:hypothetical protein